MTKLLRTTCLAASVAATALAAAPAAAAPVGATTPATARARIVKPLTLTATGQLNFADIVIPAAGVAATRTISLSDANVRDCAGGAVDVVCSGTTSVPTYNVTGTNREVVTIFKTASLLNGSNGGTLAFRPTGVNSVTLPNSGNTGVDFTIGGEIDIVPATVDGLYTGNINVTVDYQ
jgi:hypothetical protein